jgi:hypothetical protein
MRPKDPMTTDHDPAPSQPPAAPQWVEDYRSPLPGELDFRRRRGPTPPPGAAPLPVRITGWHRVAAILLRAVLLGLVAALIVLPGRARTPSVPASPTYPADPALPPLPGVAGVPQVPDVQRGNEPITGMPAKTLTGHGSAELPLDKPPGLAIVEFSCPHCTGNTVLRANGSEGLLVNVIGAYHGKRWLDAAEGSATTMLRVDAIGAWTVVVSGVEAATHVDGPGPVAGTGDDVLVDDGRPAAARIRCRGARDRFSVWVLDDAGLDLVVDTAGGADTTVPLAGPVLMQVTTGESGGQGTWSVTPS